MSTHCSAETLSAFLDRRLEERRIREVESHLAECLVCRRELEGLNALVAGLRRLDRVAPPDSLGQALERRIALESREPRLADRLEARLPRWELQPAVGLGFALVFALAVIVYLFANALDDPRRHTIPVRFEGAAPATEPAATREIGGRTLEATANGWREADVMGEPLRTVVVGSEQWQEMVAAEPALAALEELAAPVVLRWQGEVVEVAPG